MKNYTLLSVTLVPALYVSLTYLIGSFVNAPIAPYLLLAAHCIYIYYMIRYWVKEGKKELLSETILAKNELDGKR